MFTLIHTAKLNDVDPQAWLADVLACAVAPEAASKINQSSPCGGLPAGRRTAFPAHGAGEFDVRSLVRGVRDDCLADDAVTCEPVSAAKFPANREFNREFCCVWPSPAIFVSNQRADSIAYGQIPHAPEQGNLADNREVFRSSREPRGRIAESEQIRDCLNGSFQLSCAGAGTCAIQLPISGRVSGRWGTSDDSGSPRW
jgi:hypothetical protein